MKWMRARTNTHRQNKSQNHFPFITWLLLHCYFWLVANQISIKPVQWVVCEQKGYSYSYFPSIPCPTNSTKPGGWWNCLTSNFTPLVSVMCVDVFTHLHFFITFFRLFRIVLRFILCFTQKPKQQNNYETNWWRDDISSNPAIK